MIRSAGMVLLLVAATVLVWWLSLPSDWSVVPTGQPNTYASPVSARQWTAATIGLAAPAAAGGYARDVTVALLGVALPAFALFCYHTATAEVIGANLWVVGALPAAAVLAAGVGASQLWGGWRTARSPTTGTGAGHGACTLRPRRPGCSTGGVTACSTTTRHTFRVCLLAMDQLSVDDRRCRRAAQPR